MGGEGEKNGVREEELKLMLRYKLLSAWGAGEEKNISSWLKGLRTRKGNIGEDKLWALKGKGSLEKQKAARKAKPENAGGVRLDSRPRSLLFLIIKNGTTG